MSYERFIATYRIKLREAIEKHPEEYGPLPPDVIADRMEVAILRGSFNKDGRSFRATCKALGIAHTYSAIREYIEK